MILTLKTKNVEVCLEKKTVILRIQTKKKKEK